MMITQLFIRRTRFVQSLFAIAVTFAAGAEALAQTSPRAATDEGYIAVVTADKVYVRSGAANSYYPFGMLREGDLVKVMEEKYNWARVAAVGPAFGEMFGYIKQPKGEAGVLRLSANGSAGTTLGQINLIAPNIETGNAPQHSWKPIVNLPPDRNVTVLQTIDTDTQTIYAVALPADASGWVSMVHVRRADATEIRKWEDSLKAPVTLAAKPESTTTAAVKNPDVANAAPAATNPPAVASNQQPLVRETPANHPASTPASTPAPTANNQKQPATNSPNQSEPTEFSMQPPQNNDDGATVTIENEETLAESTAGEVVPEKGVSEKVARPEPPKTPKQRLESLEAAFERLRQEPIATAEVDELQRLYAYLAEEAPNDRYVHSFSAARAEQLEIWRELQQKKIELAALESRISTAGDDVQAVRYTLLTSGNYTAVGRIASSTVYDGTRLPKLYRVQDPGTGRTVAYIRPGKDHDLAGLLDQLVGIMGEKTYEGSLGLQLITPERIDLLAPHKDQRQTQGAER